MPFVVVALISLFVGGLPPNLSSTAQPRQHGAHAAPSPEALERGRYLLSAAACSSCHTPRDRPDLVFSGGRALKTPFGTFHIPNITPDHETGIGRWSDEDFIRAMREGLSPDGAHYYPAFPYRWYQNITRDDLLAMYAYLRTVPPIRNETPPHDLIFPFSIRTLIFFWKFLNMDAPRVAMQQTLTGEAQRGSYLVNAIGHCGACHTATDLIGNFDDAHALAGNSKVPGPYAAPNITMHKPAGIGGWSDLDILRVLESGIRPDGTPVRGTMSEFVTDSSSQLIEADRRAILAYLRTLAPDDREVPRTIEKKQEEAFADQSLAYSITMPADLTLGRKIAMQGSKKFEHACFRCHGADGIGSSGGVIPRLNGQSAPYLEKQLSDYAAGLRTSPVMQPIAEALGARDRKAVASYYAILAPPFAWRPGKQAAVAAQFRRGRELAEIGDPERDLMACIACHDTRGTGFAPGFPYLAGQHASYVEAQFVLWRHKRRTNDPLAVMRNIAAKISREDVRAVARYFEALALQPDRPAGHASR